MELLQRAARRWHELWRLCGAAHLFAVPQDGRRAQSVIAQEIVENLQAALEQFKLIAGDLAVENEDI